MTSWSDFSQAFLNKFGEDKTPAMLALELDRIKMESKERIKDFNQHFLTLLNKIPVASQPLEDIIIENYALALPKYLGMFVKQAGKITLVETFDEAIKVEKNSLTFESENNGKDDGSLHKRNETNSRTNTNKKDAPAFDVEKLQQAIRSLTNEVVILKRNNGEGTSNRGNFKTPYRPFTSSNARQNTPPDISTNEEVFNTIRDVYALPDSSTDQESDDDHESD